MRFLLCKRMLLWSILLLSMNVLYAESLRFSLAADPQWKIALGKDGTGTDDGTGGGKNSYYYSDQRIKKWIADLKNKSDETKPHFIATLGDLIHRQYFSKKIALDVASSSTIDMTHFTHGTRANLKTNSLTLIRKIYEDAIDDYNASTEFTLKNYYVLGNHEYFFPYYNSGSSISGTSKLLVNSPVCSDPVELLGMPSVNYAEQRYAAFPHSDSVQTSIDTIQPKPWWYKYQFTTRQHGGYYSFKEKGYRFIVLNTAELFLKYREMRTARKIQLDGSSAEVDIVDNSNLNGVSKTQLKWLKKLLETDTLTPTFIFGHCQLNYQEVEDAINGYNNKFANAKIKPVSTDDGIFILNKTDFDTMKPFAENLKAVFKKYLIESKEVSDLIKSHNNVIAYFAGHAHESIHEPPLESTKTIGVKTLLLTLDGMCREDAGTDTDNPIYYDIEVTDQNQIKITKSTTIFDGGKEDPNDKTFEFYRPMPVPIKVQGDASQNIRSLLVTPTEVSAGNYKTIMDSLPGSQEVSSKPVVHVTWYDAINYCNQRSKREGLDSVYSYTGTFSSDGSTIFSVQSDIKKSGYRLPTREEWEYLYLGGVDKDLYGGYHFPFPYHKDYSWNLLTPSNTGSIMPVGIKLSNDFGLYDMAGNVEEYTHETDGDLYIMGGSRDTYLKAYDDYNMAMPSKSESDEYRGFRVVRNAPIDMTPINMLLLD